MKTTASVTALAVAMTVACATRQPGQIPQPGFNSYTVEQDIEIGRQVAAEAEKQLPLVDNPQLQGYVSTLGQRLSRQPEAREFPYTFKMVHDENINAFALPGGPIYLNSGILINADNEGQVAGVLAHEISHVALRHGTSQASKAQFADIAALLGGAILGNSTAGQLGQLGLNLGLSTTLLSYSRAAESEADALGARIMAGAGYNPVEMATFFEKLEEQGGSRTVEFLSSHPSPGNRVTAVQKEIPYIQGPQNYNASTGNFSQMKQLAQRLPAPPKQAGR